MPKSKRAVTAFLTPSTVPLTQAKKKGREGKEKLVTLVRDCCDEFTSAYVFRYENMRNAALKELRDRLHGSARFFLGSNKVLQVALGRSPEDEHRGGLAALAARLRGDAGLVFTNMERDELETALAGAASAHHARTGCVAEETVELPAGPLTFKGGLPFPHTMEPGLRAGGVPCRLNKGVVELLAEHTVCKAGQEMDAKAASVLRMLDLKLATFTLQLDSVWENGGVTVLSEPVAKVAAMAADAFDDGDGDLVIEERDVPSDGEEAQAAKARQGRAKTAKGKSGGGTAAPPAIAAPAQERRTGGRAPRAKRA